MWPDAVGTATNAVPSAAQAAMMVSILLMS
jgi:hypothetical protein